MNPTPGPWTAWNRGIGWEIHGPNGDPINMGDSDTFTRADAMLCAAAPDLLAACRALVACNDAIECAGRPYDMALAAIKKAEGKS